MEDVRVSGMDVHVHIEGTCVSWTQWHTTHIDRPIPADILKHHFEAIKLKMWIYTELCTLLCLY